MQQSDNQAPNFTDIFRNTLGSAKALSWEAYSDLALYHPQVGYYRADKKRVGHGPTTDFYTSSSLGTVFAKLVVAAVRSIMKHADLRQYTFVEIGAEPGSSLFSPFANHFAAVETIRLGSPVRFTSPTIVFANELFDALPFHRLRFSSNEGWQVCGVALDNDQLTEVVLDEPPPSLKPLLANLPSISRDGYRLDISLTAETVLRTILEQDSVDAFVFFDYGVSWAELTHDLPQGSARSYVRHRQSNKLLENPGKQDLTCHVCWDRLSDVARNAGFETPACQRQEAFFMRWASTEIAAIISANSGHLAKERRTLQEILHPSYFGHRFQAFHGIRNR